MLDQLLALRYYTITLTTGKQSGKIHCINASILKVANEDLVLA